jgi:hypothetical protein
MAAESSEEDDKANTPDTLTSLQGEGGGRGDQGRQGRRGDAAEPIFCPVASRTQCFLWLGKVGASQKPRIVSQYF